MIFVAQLSSLAFITAALFFVLSIPLGDGGAAKSLRRAAGFAFVIAVITPALACLFVAVFRGGHSLAALGVIGLLVVLSLAAYGFLELRRLVSSRGPSRHAEGVRFAKQRPERTDDRRDEDFLD